MKAASGLTGRRTTVETVARAAGVSIATVSKVVNGRAGVSEQTREHVNAVISELGYVSIGERQRSTDARGEISVELLVDSWDIANPYITTFVQGVLEVAGTFDVGVTMRNISGVERRDPVRWAQKLARAGRSGVIELTSAYSGDRARALRAVGLPMVLVDPIDEPRTSTPSIGATNWQGAYDATRHLLDLGHRRIAYIGGPEGAACDIARAHGWSAAMAEAGLNVDATNVPRASYTFDHGLETAMAFFAKPDRPTAVFAGSDVSAMGVLEAARRSRLVVPEDVSVVGFDDTYIAAVATPPLTTVHQPIADIGRSALTTVLKLARGDALVTKRIEMATRLEVRGTTAPPRDCVDEESKSK